MSATSWKRSTRSGQKRLEQMRAQGSQCKAREDEEWRYSLIRGEMASPQLLNYGPC